MNTTDAAGDTAAPELDADYFPVAAGVEFTTTFPNPLDGRLRTFITLADGALMETTDGQMRRVTRERLAASESTPLARLEVLREEISSRFPRRDQVRRLFRSEQYPVLDALIPHLNTADQMTFEGAGEQTRVLDRWRTHPGGEREWLIGDQWVLGYELWNCGWMPAWTTGTEPVWQV